MPANANLPLHRLCITLCILGFGATANAEDITKLQVKEPNGVVRYY
jgi:hypothetical protein